jgi:hypothetical protein
LAEYRIICVVRGSGGDLEAVGYSESGNGVIYDDRWTLEQARAAIEEGHRLYIVTPVTGDRTDLELDEDGFRLSSDLEDLPVCGG